MKRAILSLMLVIGITLTGCGQMSEEAMQTNEVSSAQTASLPKKDLSAAVYLTAEDTVPGTYAEPLSAEISAAYLDRLKSVAQSTPSQSGLVMRSPLYSLCIQDGDHQMIDKWDIDDYRTIRTSDGTALWREGELDTLLTEIEEQYSLGYALLDRVPGEQYLSVLTQADHASAAKSGQNNLEKQILLDIKADRLESLKTSWQQIGTGTVRVEDIRPAYTIVFYNADGNAVQNWLITADNEIYTAHGYALEGDLVHEWVDAIVKDMLK